MKEKINKNKYNGEISGQAKLPLHLEITAITGFEGGFICACGPDRIFMFQKSENIHEYYTQVSIQCLLEIIVA